MPNFVSQLIIHNLAGSMPSYYYALDFKSQLKGPSSAVFSAAKSCFLNP